MLHILMSQAPHWPERLNQTLSPTDALLLAGDGVYLASQFAHLNTVYARAHDLQQRGLTIPPHVITITDAQWVELTLSHQPVVSWI